MDNKSIDKAVKEARRKYFRNWRKNNADRVKKYNEDYWLRKAEKLLSEEADTREGNKSSTNNDDSKRNC